MGNIVFGVLMILGGLSGEFALIGTNSGGALAVVGGIVLIIGIAQISNKGD